MKTINKLAMLLVSIWTALFCARPTICQGDQFYDTDLTGDVDDGPIYISQGDIDNETDFGQGGTSLAQRTKKAFDKKAGISAARNSPEVMRASKAAARSLPGVSLMGASIVPVMFQNAKVIQAGTNQTISGNLWKFNIDASPIVNPFLTVTKQVQGNANPGVEVNVTFADADKPAGCLIFSSPVAFITISSSTLNARAGSRYTLSVTGKSRDGVSVTTDAWQFERASDKPMRITYIPYVRQKDTIVPIAVGFGDIGGIAENVSLVFAITGMPDTETMQVVMPGLDSSEYAETLKQWGLNIK